jgi:hypothetical protein
MGQINHIGQVRSRQQVVSLRIWLGGSVGQVGRWVKWEGGSSEKAGHVATWPHEINLVGQMGQKVQVIQMIQVD